MDAYNKRPTSQCMPPNTKNLFFDESNGFNLLYYFCSEPKPIAPPDMHSHYGFADISFDKNSFQKAESNYFTGRDREYFGTIIYAKQSNQLTKL